METFGFQGGGEIELARNQPLSTYLANTKPPLIGFWFPSTHSKISLLSHFMHKPFLYYISKIVAPVNRNFISNYTRIFIHPFHRNTTSWDE